jgi:hypothetical protein
MAVLEQSATEWLWTDWIASAHARNDGRRLRRMVKLWVPVAETGCDPIQEIPQDIFGFS